MEDYRAIADALAADIAEGRLRPGDRLPPQRRFARARGIAASTAARVYRELTRRGLVVGEVGRGTYVRAGQPPADPALAEPGAARVDLELNMPMPVDHHDLLTHGLGVLAGPEALTAALRPVGAAGTPPARAAAATVLARAGWRPDEDRVLFAGNGKQAIAAAVAALVPRGGRLGVEALTYPVVKGIATRLGIELVPLAVDDDGLDPDAVRSARPHAIYVQPTLHNPLGITMPADRRAALADVLRTVDIPAVEDTVYAFLREEPPLAAYAPERTVLVDSLSKRVAPGLTVGFLVSPDGVTDRVAAALRSGAWLAPGFAVDIATRWIDDGAAATIQDGKRRDAARRQAIVHDRLGTFGVVADPGSYHCWWELPDHWRAETFVAAAARRGIAVSPAGAFAVGAARAPAAVRLALASPPLPALEAAVDVLAGLAGSAPEDEFLE